MSRRTFIVRCRQVLNDCTRCLLMEDAESGVHAFTLSRLQTLQRSLMWARGRLISVAEADPLLSNLAEMIQEITMFSQPVQHRNFSYQAPLGHSGRKGRPSYVVTREQLSFLRSCGFTASQISGILGVSAKTVKRRLRLFNMTRSFSAISDADLDEVVQDIVAGNDLIGPEAVRASLRADGVRVQRQRVRASMLRLNPGAAALRSVLHRPRRRSYRVAGPNSLWHIDGNHKLIRWRIVIHGAIDGYSRLLVFLKASTNNRSSTVLENFVHAVASYGVPSRVRTDRGGENSSICLMMNIFRGFQRGSAIQGRSVHNQRIERLWGDLWRGMTNVYYDLFNYLESEGVVDCDNEIHMWALHYIYLPRINRDLRDFAEQWNNHGIRTERHMSPLQIFVRGCLEQQNRPSTAMDEMFRAGNATEDAPGFFAPEDAPSETPVSSSQAEELGLLLDWPERVTVPEVQFTLGDQVAEQVTAQFDPLSGPRGDHGLKLICDLISFLTSDHD